MAAIFPPANKGGIAPGPNVTNGYLPVNAVTGEGPLYASNDCTTVLTAEQLNGMVSEILAAVDKLGFSYNSNRVTNLGDALTDWFATIQANKVSRAGDTMTGPLILPADPVAPMQAATMQYADMKVAKAGDFMTGFLTLNADPTNDLHAATKHYVDVQDTATLAQSQDADAVLESEIAKKVSKSGDVLTGALTLAADPTANLQAATKQYVDAHSGVAGNANPLMNSAVAAPGTALPYARVDHVHPTDTTRAPLASPVFTGDPKAPTPTLGDNDTSIATTAFVMAAVSAGGSFIDAPSDGSSYGRLNTGWTKVAPLASPTLTGDPKAPTPTAGDNDTSIATTAFVAAAIAAATAGSNVVGQTNCGQLTYVSTTALAFKPYNGNTIRIGGTIFQIPAAGIAGLGAPTSVFLNGVAAQALAAGVIYYVHAFNNAGVITADFVTGTGHSTSTTAGNIGTEVKTGDESRTLIGMILTGSGTYGGGMTTLSWFNRRSKSNYVSTSGGTIQAVQGFITWGDEAVSMSYEGYLSASGISNNSARHYLDSAGFGQTCASTTPGANYTTPHSGRLDAFLAEGYHTYGVSLSFTGTASAAVFSSSVAIRG